MIEYTDVTKVYRSPLGRTVSAVEGFSLRIEPGEVLGLAGPNGAGKSTLINLLLGYLSPTSGTVRVDGRSPRAYVEREGIGYLSELIAIPPRWTLDQAMLRYALLAGVPDRLIGERVEQAITRFGLEEHRFKRVKQLSKGTLQRLGLAQALLRDERVMILDEPTHGLDPVWTQRFRALVDEMRDPGRTMLVASHNLDELDRIADRVAIIDGGRLQRVVSTRRSATAPVAARYRVVVASGADRVASCFAGAREIGTRTFDVAVSDVHALNASIGAFLADGGQILEIAPLQSELERSFSEAIREVS